MYAPFCTSCWQPLVLTVEKQTQAKQQQMAPHTPDMRTFPSQILGQPGPKKTWEEIVCPGDKHAWDGLQPAGTPGRSLCKGL